MKTLTSALALAGYLAAGPVLAAEQAQISPSDPTYAPMFAYYQANPHAKAPSAAVEQAAEMKAAESRRAEQAQWASVMGRGDVPEEYLPSGHK